MAVTVTPRVQIYDFSNPDLYNPTYIPLMQNKSEFLHLWGSAGSGKSRFEAQKEIVKSFNPQRARRKTIVARKVFATLKESCYDELKQAMFEFGLSDLFHCTTSPLHITNMVTDVEFTFRGFDNIEKIKSIVGADRAWYEEATESSGMEEVTQLRNRLRGFKEVQLTMSYNPVDEHNWINEEIHEKGLAGHYLHHSTYRDNVKMLAKDPNYAAFIEGTKESMPNYYRVYGLGLWGRVIAGLVYDEVEIISEFPKDGRGRPDIHHYGLDFGMTNPTALVAQHIQDSFVVRQGQTAPKKNLVNELLLYKSGLDAPNLISEFERIGVRKDLIIIADSARPEMIKSLRDAGYRVRPCIKFAGSVLSGINDVRKFNFQVVAGSKELIKEARNYMKGKKEGKWIEEPAKYQVDHALDAVRYAVQKAVVPQIKNRKKVTSHSQSMFE